MGVRVWKEVLCLGRQQDRHGRRFTFTRQDIQDAYRNCRKMLGRGIFIPCCWEHQSTAEPRFLSRDEAVAAYAKHTFGGIVDARINDRGNLECLHDVPDTRDAHQLVKTRFVSPKVYPSYSDSRGGKYRGTTIGHVAATPTPVQYWQRPFELSQADAIYLSYTPEGDMAKEDTDDKGGGNSDLQDLIEALRGAGMTIPDEVADLKHLVIAIKASAGGGGGDDDLDLDAPAPDVDPSMGGGDSPAGMTGAPSPPMLMSDGQAEPLRRMTRRDLKHRIQELFNSGRINRPTAVSLWQEARTITLSFTSAGELTQNPVVARVEAYEKLPREMAWAGRGRRAKGSLDLSMTDTVNQPHEFTGSSMPQPSSEFQGWIDGLLSRIPGKAAK